MKEKKEKEDFEEENASEGSAGVAESVLDGMGNLIPGLGGIIKGLKKSDAFRERLASIDEEVERRLAETVARRGTKSRKHFDTFTAGHAPKDKGEKEIAVDVFEEEKKIRVIAELPGVNEEDIRLDLNEETLTISASRGNRSYYKSVKLPRACESIIGKIYNNGILEVTLN